MNISNFGIDCRNNIDNQILEPIYDEISEIAFIKKYDNIFTNERYLQFSHPNIITQEVNEKYDKLILDLDKSDSTYLSRKYSYEIPREKDIDSIKTMEQHKKRSGKNRVFHKINDKIDQVSKSRTTKMIVDFCAEEAASIKSFAVKERQEVQVTTRFLSGKMLMFAKLSLMSFIYEMLETFCFPDEKV